MRSRRLVFAFALILPGILGSFACGLDETPLTGLPNTNGASDAAGVDGTIGADGSIGDANTSDAAHLDGGGPDGSIVTPTLVYANTQTDLFSFDVDSRTLTHVAQLSAQCGNNLNDIAINSSGQIYIFESNDAIYELATDGGCSGRNTLDSLASDDLKLTGRNAGTPAVVAIDTSHEDYDSIDPAGVPHAPVVKITNNLFSDGSPKFDIACAQGGTCWTALDQSHCSAGSAGSCLYSFAADGSGTPTLLGAINVHPNGLAYAKGSLYGFDDDGAIAKISIGPGPVASVFSPAMITLASGTTQPTAWNGAASTSAYP
jgi:hypothetical protein